MFTEDAATCGAMSVRIHPLFDATVLKGNEVDIVVCFPVVMTLLGRHEAEHVAKARRAYELALQLFAKTDRFG